MRSWRTVKRKMARIMMKKKRKNKLLGRLSTFHLCARSSPDRVSFRAITCLWWFLSSDRMIKTHRVQANVMVK